MFCRTISNTKPYLQSIAACILCDVLMWYFYHKIEKKLTENEMGSNFVLSELSRQRNRRALKTLRFLLIIFAVTVAPGRILFLVTAVMLWTNRFMVGYWLWAPYIYPVFILSSVLVYSNYVVNVFVYIKMFPDFRRFLLRIFSFGRCGKRNERQCKTVKL